MGMEFKHILFTSDLTSSARYVFDHAISLADKYGAKITIMHVLEEVSPNMRGALVDILGESRLKELRSKYRSEAMTTLVGKSREHAIIRDGLIMFHEDAVSDQPGLKIKSPDDVVVIEGNVIEEIIRRARESSCDLIVMGAYRSGRLSTAVLGSVVRGVLNKADVPVFVVPLKKSQRSPA